MVTTRKNKCNGILSTRFLKINQNKMWVRTISGWVFFDVTYTIQGIPMIIPNEK